MVAEFEEKFAERIGSKYAVAVATACAVYAPGRRRCGARRRVIVDPIVQFGALAVL